VALSFQTRAYSLRLRAPLWTARGSIERRDGWLLRIRDGDGVCGWGEACPLPGFVDERAAAAHAYDEAFLDLSARRAGVPLARLLGGSGAAAEVRVNALDEADAAGCRCVKLKVGADLEAGLQRVATARARLGPAVALRVDANGAWTLQQALQALQALEDLGVELLEQPLAAEDVAGLARLRGRSRVLIAADEAVRDLHAARRLLQAGAADVLVLKPMALGGLLPAAAIAAEAREAGAGVVVTTTLEGAVGRAGAVHLAAAAGSVHLAHGLATGALLLEDIAAGLEPRDGAIRIPEAPGLGVQPW
jgi:L-alanine-DL-glutamate epimerase-like enolase superfamily enzyme